LQSSAFFTILAYCSVTSTAAFLKGKAWFFPTLASGAITPTDPELSEKVKSRATTRLRRSPLLRSLTVPDRHFEVPATLSGKLQSLEKLLALNTRLRPTQSAVGTSTAPPAPNADLPNVKDGSPSIPESSGKSGRFTQPLAAGMHPKKLKVDDLLSRQVVTVCAKVISTVDPRVSQEIGHRGCGPALVFDKITTKLQWLKRLKRSYHSRLRLSMPGAAAKTTRIVIQLTSMCEFAVSQSTTRLDHIRAGSRFDFADVADAARWLEDIGHLQNIPSLISFAEAILSAAPPAIQIVNREVESLDRTHAQRPRDVVKL
jgi:hypothetical protein